MLSVTLETRPNSKGGTYQVAEIAHKDLSTGKVNGKKIMSFIDPKLFALLTDNAAGKQFEIVMAKEPAKDGKEYWNWKSAQPLAAGSAKPSTGSVAAASATVRSTYETPTERAERQVLIVRQSSLDRALDNLSIGTKQPVSNELVFKQAQEYVDWVFDTKPKATAESLTKIPNDLPFDFDDVA